MFINLDIQTYLEVSALAGPGSGKVELHVTISEKLNKKFREFLARKYGYIRKGIISEEVESALWAWIAEHTHKEHKFGAGRVNPEPKYRRIYDQVKRWLSLEYGYDFNEVAQVPKKHMVEAIAAVRGSDKRTIEKWLRLFTDKGLIKWLSPNLIEVVR